MESGNPAHQQAEQQGGLVPAKRTIQRPLLPYEKQLIDLLGCSVEEYEFFVAEAEKRNGVRPAEYDLVPDIQNTGAEIIAIISLVVGLASTALSLLLAPKPRSAEDQRGGNVQLASRNGVDRFSQTSGFDSIIDMAQYGDAVPIIWTKYNPDLGTGGVLVSPRLVWSRMLSENTHQVMKLLMVIGESGVTAPDLAGVYIGSNALNSLGPASFALWWNDTGRPTRADLLYGTQTGPTSGDPQTNSDIFTTGLGPTGFSQAYTPSNNVQFGVSNPLPNGTQYRPNYKIVSRPKDTGADGKRQLFWDRAKVVGYPLKSDFSPVGNDPRNGGLGYGYYRRQGIVGYSAKSNFSASVGTRIRYLIAKDTLRTFFDNSSGPGGNLQDISNAINSECAAADDLLQLGETIIINSSVWRVVDRSLGVWLPTEDQIITLECIEVLESPDIRVLGDQYIYSTAGEVNLHYGNPDQSFKSAGAVFDNLVRFTGASIKNTRACRITHIGIRSQVWGRFNGVCNFNSLPTGGQVNNFDNSNVSVQSGTMSEYFMRTSAFTLYYREAGEADWIKTGLRFCVRGSTPIDQFHNLTINHGSFRALEFRLVPMPAAFVNRLGENTQLYWLTGSKNFQTLTAGSISVYAAAEPITIGECKLLDQMVCSGDPKNIREFEESTGIAEVSHYGSLITHSCDNGPEHQVVYVNEMITPNPVPSYSQITMAGLSIRSGRNIRSLEQPRFWISSGVNDSNSFPELVQYLLGRASSIDERIVDTGSFTEAANFCNSRGLFFDGVISESANMRSYIASLAPFFMLNFVIANGKFSLMPALPEGLPNVTNIFTAGNIVEGSFNLTYLPLDQRRDFQAMMVYRRHYSKNALPVLESVRIRFADVPTSAPIETFDMSAYCTSRDHAVQIARYFLSLRRRVTHGITFKAVPDNAAGIAPGNYIKVAVEQNVINSTGNGIVSATGQITSVTPLANGSYPIVYYKAGDQDVSTGTMTVTNGFTADTQLFGALFSQQSSSITTNTYLIEQVELDEDSLVTVTATEFPASLLDADMTGAGMIVEGDTVA